MIVLCRHGATDGNAAGAFLSRGDPPLNALGRVQCERVAAALRVTHFDACWASPALRCVQTRDIIAPHVPFATDPALREVDFGAWEGKTAAWLRANRPDELTSRGNDPVSFRHPGGESFADVAVRLQPFVERLDRRSSILVVGHRGTLGVLERILRGLPLASREVVPMEPCELRTISDS